MHNAVEKSSTPSISPSASMTPPSVRLNWSISGDPGDWDCATVALWLKSIGFERYANLLAVEHKVDGKILVCLTEGDLREKPLQMTVLGDIKRLYSAIERLKRTAVEMSLNSTGHPLNGSSLVAFNGAPLSPILSRNDLNGELYDGFGHFNVDLDSSSGPKTSYVYQRISETKDSSNGISIQSVEYRRQNVIDKIEAPDTPMKALIKTGLAAVYCCFSLLLTSFVMVIVHDRVPDMKTYPPLPDIVLDSIPLIPWAFKVCELLACSLGTIWSFVLIFHKRRIILLRRMFSLTGTVFLLRCVTMLITSLSVPGVHLDCCSQHHIEFSDKLKQAFHIWFGMGMSLRGVRTCGDYMFSGHTTAVTLLNHFVTEYTPDDWYYIHTASWVMNLFSIFFILAGHEHYSIDVFIAFYISSRLFLYYHSMAYHTTSLALSDGRTRMWFPLFWFFESGGRVGRVANEYEWPLPDAETCAKCWNSLSKFVQRAVCLPNLKLKFWRQESRDSCSNPKAGKSSKKNVVHHQNNSPQHNNNNNLSKKVTPTSSQNDNVINNITSGKKSPKNSKCKQN